MCRYFLLKLGHLFVWQRQEGWKDGQRIERERGVQAEGHLFPFSAQVLPEVERLRLIGEFLQKHVGLMCLEQSAVVWKPAETDRDETEGEIRSLGKIFILYVTLADLECAV